MELAVFIRQALWTVDMIVFELFGFSRPLEVVLNDMMLV